MAIFSGFSFKPIVALAVLVIVAGAAAYYFYVYLPETEGPPAKAVQVTVKPTKVAKPTVVQSPPAASAVPPVAAISAPVAAPVRIASVAQPVPEQKSDSVKSEPAAQKPAPKKPKVKKRPVRTTKVAKPKVAESKVAEPKVAEPKVAEPSVPAKTQQIVPPNSMVLPVPVLAATEPKIITPKYNDMLTAVLRGDIEGVKQLLDLGRWVDKPGPSGMTPLMAGVMNRDTQMVQFLLEHGAKPSSQAIDLARKNKDSAIVLLLEQQNER